MTYSLRFLPEVVDDAIAGYGWYEAKAAGLGDEFLQLLYSTAGKIPENPLSSQRIHGAIRRCLLRKFPYAIYYRIEGEEVVVLGVFHCARDPRGVEQEMRRRS